MDEYEQRIIPEKGTEDDPDLRPGGSRNFDAHRLQEEPVNVQVGR
jgi:hypothetical protein